MIMPLDNPTIQQQYFKQQLETGIRKILATQLAIATDKIYSDPYNARRRSGALRVSLENPSYMITGSGSGVNAEVKWPTYIRFLDMKRFGNKKIYNRPVWGILYKETYNNIRYEFSDWLRKNFPDKLKIALNPQTK